MPSLNLIAWDNGVGLSRDLQLLSSALRNAGYEVHVSPLRRGKLRAWLRPWRMRTHLWRQHLAGGAQRSRYDANIMLEHVRAEDLHYAWRNFFIPNPEWCLPSDVALLDRVDAVLAKTRHAVDIFAARGCRTAFIGFTSEDRRNDAVPRERVFFHLAGQSRNKGTERLLALWQRHPEWPRLTVVQNPRLAKTRVVADNIDHRVDVIDEAELLRLQNASWFHLCPSETEGFGHYLVEAMGIGNVAIALDAPPMNEMVDATRGVLVAHGSSGTQHLATTYFFDEAAAEAAIEDVLARSDTELQQLGLRARAWFLHNDAEFKARLKSALDPLLK